MRRLNKQHITYFFAAGIIVILVLFWGAGRFILTSKELSQSIPAPNLPLTNSEKSQIETWIKKNQLNVYGDRITTVYTGGTPLFDESTGQRVDRFTYIVRRHPDRPWKK